jgi:hypothetical protein
MPLALRLLLAIALGVAVIVGIIWLGHAAKEDLALVVDQLDVPSPPNMSRNDFLAEVRYQGNLPDKLHRGDPATAERLKQAFSKHPWVESVEIGPMTQAQPVIVRLRVPALAVGGRVLDRNGVLLPLRTATTGLPEYLGPGSSKDSESGKPFNDAAVVEVAKRVGWLQTQIPDLKWKIAELSADGLSLIRADGFKVIWGKDANPPEDQKLAKLRAWSSGDLDLRKN